MGEMEQIVHPNAPYIRSILKHLDLPDWVRLSWVCRSWQGAIREYLEKERSRVLKRTTYSLLKFEHKFLLSNLSYYTCTYCQINMGISGEEVGWLSVRHFDTHYCSNCWNRLSGIDQVVAMKYHLSHVVGLLGQGGTFLLNVPEKYEYQGNFQYLEVWIQEYLERLYLFYPILINNLGIRHQYLTLWSWGSLFDWLPVKKFKLFLLDRFSPYFDHIFESFGFELRCSNPENPKFGERLWIHCDTIHTGWYTEIGLLPGKMEFIEI